MTETGATHTGTEGDGPRCCARPMQWDDDLDRWVCSRCSSTMK